MLTTIDLKAALGKLTMLRGRTPQTTQAEREGSAARLATYRDGGIFTSKFSGSGWWERHSNGDELVQVIDGAATLYVMTDEGPQVVAASGGTLLIVPRGMWHRFESPVGVTLMTATPQPTDHPAIYIEDPRTLDQAVAPEEGRRVTSVDLAGAFGKLKMLRGRRPDMLEEERKASAAFATLAPYRDGNIFSARFSGKGAWERHPNGDELVQVVDGATAFHFATEDGLQSRALEAGMMVIVPQGMWHRFASADGVALMTATPKPTEHLTFEVEDPRALPAVQLSGNIEEKWR
jgi:mannose-6-phosphate isomerase-like protein (cupin superfamily)